jgi:very-short-patch-repair endonuclease
MSDAPVLEPAIGAERGADATIANLAESQHGVVSRRQLLEFGLGRRAIGHRLERGRLHMVHRGVYAVGHRILSRDGRWMAAVLAAGADAVLSHRSAAALWGLRETAAARVDVTVPRWSRPRASIRTHQAALAADEITVSRGIPVTTPPRTLLDLASVVSAQQLERAVSESEVLRLTDALSLADLVARHCGRPGVPVIRRVLEAGRVGAVRTRSELEERFLAFLDAEGLPRPEVNARLETPAGWFEVDCVWRRERVIVELDGYASHGTLAAFERDRARDRALQAAGWRVIRIMWRHLHEHPGLVAAELRALLRATNPTLSPR